MRNKKESTPMQTQKKNQKMNLEKWKEVSQAHDPKQISDKLAVPVIVITLFIMFIIVFAYLLGAW